MHKKIMVGTNSDPTGLYALIANQLQEKNVQTELVENNISVHIDSGQEQDIKPLIAKAAGNYIVDELEQNVVSKVLKSEYAYFSPHEYREIMMDVKKRLSENADDDMFLKKRKNVIIKRIEEYLLDKDTIIIDGFLSFRLRDYIDAIGDITHRSTDDFLMTKEYNEFLNLLKYFVSVQDCRIDFVNVIATGDGRYILTDRHQNPLEDEETLSFIQEMGSGALEPDDMLISSLISLSPGEIVLHNASCAKKEMVSTIEKVFEGKVKRCEGCDLCKIGGKKGGPLQ